MSVHRRGAKWVVRYSDGARQRQRTFDRRVDAQRFDDETRRRRQLGTLATLSARARTLDAYVEHEWTPTYAPLLAPRTREVYALSYDRHVAPRVGEHALHALTPAVLARWQAAMLSAGAGHPTIAKARTVLSAVLSAAVADGLLAGNPLRQVRAPKAPMRDEVRPLAPASVEAIRAVCGPRDAILVSLLAYSGLRPQEARTLRWGHVGERTLVVHAPKTNSRRTVRLLEPLAQDLRAWRLRCGRPDDGAVVVPGVLGPELSDRAFNHWRHVAWRAALDAAGLPYQRPYDLRHSFASLLLHEGRSVIYVARQLGHAPVLTLSTYSHVIDELDGQPGVSAEDAIRAAREEQSSHRLRTTTG